MIELPVHLVGDLRVPDGILAAGSGIEIVHERVYVVADDHVRLAVFALDAPTDGRWITLSDEQLPEEHAARKATKPDLECVVALGTEVLLALPSGSTPRRQRGFALSLDPDGVVSGSPRAIDMSPVYGDLAARIGDVPNVEGAVAAGDRLALLVRGVTGANHVAVLDLARVRASVRTGALSADALLDIHAVELGDIGGISLGFTDGAWRAGSIVFTAAAEDTDNAYDDGTVAGSVIGTLELGASRPVTRWALPEAAGKIEGIAFAADDSESAWLVTDDDDPGAPARLYHVDLPV